MEDLLMEIIYRLLKPMDRDLDEKINNQNLMSLNLKNLVHYVNSVLDVRNLIVLLRILLLRQVKMV